MENEKRAEQIKRIEELVEKLNDGSKAYYGGEPEIMSNYEWDEMFNELDMLETETGYILENSPTQVLTEEISGEKEVHEFPALSLAKTKLIADVKKWTGYKKVYVSWKLDGLTLVLTYEKGKLIKILTRGDGITGTNVLRLAAAILGIPLEIECQDHLVIRGEATISYTNFDLINLEIEDENEKYANPRNLAGGTLTLDDPNAVAKRQVEFTAFNLVSIESYMPSWKERMDYLSELGFTVVEHREATLYTVEETIDYFTKKVENGEMDIPVDGLVVCYDDLDFVAKGTSTSHHAEREGLAFKWEDIAVRTKLIHIEWSPAVSTISPVAVFESVKIEGTTVSRASLCNISEMERLGITDDCMLDIIKANKIIPKCIGVSDAKGTLNIPTHCPVCHHATEIKVSEKSKTKTLVCTNDDCAAKNLKKFKKFVSRDGMNIDGLSVETLSKLIAKGFIEKFSDIFSIEAHKDAIITMEGFGERSYSKMLKAINKSKDVEVVKFIYSLNIPLIGHDASKRIIAALGMAGLLEYLKNGKSFDSIQGIGIERSDSLVNWYKVEANRNELEKLLTIVKIKEPLKASGDKCKGKTFVITGEVEEFDNRKALSAYIEAQGGKVSSGVTSKTNYLVNNDALSNSTKNKSAKDLGVEIISEKQFIELFGK